MYYVDDDIYIRSRLNLSYVYLASVSLQPTYKKYKQVAELQRFDKKSDGSVKYVTCTTSFSKPTMHASSPPTMTVLSQEVSVNTIFLMISRRVQLPKSLCRSLTSLEMVLGNT